jgi:multidrug efflux pump subunit AcrA (membrane-fusion protein)
VTATVAADGSAVTWRAAWAAALDELELDLERAEALISRDHSVRDANGEDLLRGVTWTPPDHLPPLPAELVDRARAVLDRQTAAAAGLALAMSVNRRQALLAARMSAEEAARPNYVDRAV